MQPLRPTIRHIRFPIVGVLAWILASTVQAAEPASAPEVPDTTTVTPAGEFLAQTLDRMDVEHHWMRTHNHIAWRTGLQLTASHGKRLIPLSKDESHCSAFAAAAADNLGVNLLHPPEHSHVLLSNAQYDWLASPAGREAGWHPVADAVTAQVAANQGELVLAVCKNPDVVQAGHIAIVRPESKSADAIAADGPQITQAGYYNYRSASLREGFRYHPGAWPPQGKAGVRFYAHTVDPAQLAGE